MSCIQYKYSPCNKCMKEKKKRYFLLLQLVGNPSIFLVIPQKKKHLVTCVSPSPFSYSKRVILFMGYNTDYTFSLRRQTDSCPLCILGLSESVCCCYLISVAMRNVSPHPFIFPKGLLGTYISFFFSLLFCPKGLWNRRKHTPFLPLKPEQPSLLGWAGRTDGFILRWINCFPPGQNPAMGSLQGIHVRAGACSRQRTWTYAALNLSGEKLQNYLSCLFLCSTDSSYCHATHQGTLCTNNIKP